MSWLLARLNEGSSKAGMAAILAGLTQMFGSGTVTQGGMISGGATIVMGLAAIVTKDTGAQK